jgi:hypothetical protein
MIRFGVPLLGLSLLLAGRAHAEQPPGVQQVIYIDVDLKNAPNVEKRAGDRVLQRQELINQFRTLCVGECACWDWAPHVNEVPRLRIKLKTNARRLDEAALTATVYLEYPQGQDTPICTIPPLEVCPPGGMANHLKEPDGKDLYQFIADSLHESFKARIKAHRGNLRRANVPVSTGIVQLTTDGFGAILPLPWERLSPHGSYTFRIDCPRNGRPSLEITARGIPQPFRHAQSRKNLLTVYYVSLKDPADPAVNLHSYRDKLKDLDYGSVYWAESNAASNSDWDQ